MYRPHTKCRACQSNELIPVVNFGLQPLANDFRRPTDERGGHVPLKVLFCPKCTLGQLSVVVDPKILYSNYAYVTSPSETMKRHFESLLKDIQKRQGPQLGNILEIGSNDGALLKFLKPHAQSVLGIDPAENLAMKAREAGIETLCRPFERKGASGLPLFDLIIARHVFGHVDDWLDFLNGIELCATEKTLIVIEAPYAGDLLGRREFDTIYHEHLSYLTITAVKAALARTALYLEGIISYPVHGGAFAFLIRKRTGHEDEMLPIGVEPGVSIDRWRQLEDWSKEAAGYLAKRITYLNGTKSRVCGYGASAKSTLWLNLCGFSKKHLEFIHDETPYKDGCLAPGTDIPVVNNRKALNEGITHAVLFAWNYCDEIVSKEAQFIKDGGKFIVPVPEFMVIPAGNLL